MPVRDPSLPHQIVLYMVGQGIALSCNCLAGIDGSKEHHSPIEVRSRWEFPEVMAAYVAYHEQERVVVPIGVGRLQS